MFLFTMQQISIKFAWKFVRKRHAVMPRQQTQKEARKKLESAEINQIYSKRNEPI